MLEARDLVKRYYGITVVDRVSLTIRPGEVGRLPGTGAIGFADIRNLRSHHYFLKNHRTTLNSPAASCLGISRCP